MIGEDDDLEVIGGDDADPFGSTTGGNAVPERFARPDRPDLHRMAGAIVGQDAGAAGHDQREAVERAVRPLHGLAAAEAHDLRGIGAFSRCGFEAHMIVQIVGDGR